MFVINSIRETKCFDGRKTTSNISAKSNQILEKNNNFMNK